MSGPVDRQEQLRERRAESISLLTPAFWQSDALQVFCRNPCIPLEDFYFVNALGGLLKREQIWRFQKKNKRIEEKIEGCNFFV